MNAFEAREKSKKGEEKQHRIIFQSLLNEINNACDHGYRHVIVSFMPDYASNKLKELGYDLSEDNGYTCIRW